MPSMDFNQNFNTARRAESKVEIKKSENRSPWGTAREFRGGPEPRGLEPRGVDLLFESPPRGLAALATAQQLLHQFWRGS